MILALLLACSGPKTEAPSTVPLWGQTWREDLDGVRYRAPDGDTWRVPLDGPGVLAMWLGLAQGANEHGQVTVRVGDQPATTYPVQRQRELLRVPVDASGADDIQVQIQTTGEVVVGAPSVYQPETHPRRIVLVMVDTLRADHLGAWGYPRPTSPEIDALALQGTRWDQCYSPHPWTLPATRVLLTGQPAWRSPGVPTLATRLSEAGWITGAITRNPWLRAENGVGADFAMDDSVQPPDARAATDRAITWLDQVADRSTFLFLHHMDPHTPYGSPAPAELTDSPVERPDLSKRRSALVADYDTDVRYVDTQIGRLWAHLRDMPGDSLLVLTADHGEEFWEHGGLEHGQSLHDELLHVPLLAAGTGVEAARVVSEPVSLFDVAPTILGWAGVEGRGRDLLRTPLAPAEPVVLGETISGGEAWGLFQGGRRYWLQSGHEHVPEGDSAEAWRARLEEIAHVSVREGGTLLLRQSASTLDPPVRTISVDWGVPVRQVRAAPGGGWSGPMPAGVEAEGSVTTLHLEPSSSGALAVELARPAPRRVLMSVNGGEPVSVPTHRRAVALPGTTQPRPIIIGAGPIAWPLAGAPPRSSLVVPGETVSALQSLGYIER